MKPAPLLLLAVGLLAPVGSAYTVSMDLSFRTPVLADVDQEDWIDDEDAQELRAVIDGTVGNGDNTVTSQEVADFELLFRDFLNGGGVDQVVEANVTLDAIEGQILFSRMDIYDAEGSIASRKRIRLESEFNVSFDLSIKASHRFRIEAPAQEGNGTTATTWSAPAGYRFGELNGFPSGTSLSPDRRRLSFDEPVDAAVEYSILVERIPVTTTTRTPTVDDAPSSSRLRSREGWPIPAVDAFVVALAAAALVLRLRRQG